MNISRLWLLIIIMLSGCNTLTPNQPLNIDPITASPYHNTLILPQNTSKIWWRQFDDEQLNALIDQLLSTNLTLLSAQARLKESQANLSITDAALLPWLNLAATGERIQTPGIIRNSTGNNHSVQAMLGYEVDLWDKLDLQRSAAHQQLLITDAEIDGLYLSLTAHLTSLYFSHQEQQQHSSFAQKQLAIRRNYLTFIRNRYNLGVEKSRSIYTAEQAVDLAQNAVQTIQINLNSTEHSIALLLGVRRNQLNLKPSPHFVETMLAPNIGLPADLLLQRPDVIAAWHRFAAADAQHAAAIAERLPTISLQAGVGLLHNTLGSASINDLFWSLTANALQPLIDGGKRIAVVSKNKAIVEQRQLEAQQTLLNAVYEVEDLLDKMAGTTQIIKQLDHRNQQAESNFTQVEQQYGLGLADALHLLEATDTSLSARRQLLTSRYQLLTLTIQLTRAVGGVWMNTIRSEKELL